MFSIVLWDIDNTLLDFDYAEESSIRETFSLLGLGNVTDEMISRYREINNRYWNLLERGLMSKNRILVARFEDFFSLYGIDSSKADEFDNLYEINLGHYVRFRKGGSEAVMSLKGKVIQCAVTNGCESVQRKKLSESGLDRVFDKVFISDVIGYEKPSPLFFDAVFRSYPSVKSSEMLLIGDSLSSDIAGANNAGIPCIWYNPSGRRAKESITVLCETDSLEEAALVALRSDV